MNKEATKKLAFAVGIVVIVLSSILFLWATYQAIGYGYDLQQMAQNELYEAYPYIISNMKIWLAIRIVFSVLSLLLLSGVVFLFTYFYKKEKEVKAQQKEELNK